MRLRTFAVAARSFSIRPQSRIDRWGGLPHATLNRSPDRSGMIRTEREVAIVRLLERQGVVSVRGLTQRWPAVSAVTLRRDLARLEASGRLRRTRGGAVRADARLVSRPGPAGTDEE